MEKISVKAARIDAGLTQEEVANKLNIHAQTYMKLEKSPEKMTVRMANDFCKIVNRNLEAIYFLPAKSN